MRLTYRKRPITTLLSTALAVILPATLVVAASQLGGTRGAPEHKKPVINSLTWQWSDGSADSHRVFAASAYRSAKDLPHLIFRVPLSATSVMTLEFLQDGEWNAEWMTKPDENGVASVPFDPYCANDTWCDGEYRYRVRQGQRISYFNVDYWER